LAFLVYTFLVYTNAHSISKNRYKKLDRYYYRRSIIEEILAKKTRKILFWKGMGQ